MVANTNTGLQGLRIVSFESRRAQEIGELIRRYGGEAVIAPSMREIPLSQNSAAIDFLRQLEAGKIDIVIFLTGVGTRALVEAVASEYPRETLAAALGACHACSARSQAGCGVKGTGITAGHQRP